MFNARNIATGVIATVVLALFTSVIAESVAGLAMPIALAVSLALFLFRNRLFAILRGQVDVALDKSAKAVTGAIERPEAEPAFDPDAAFARYMEKRVLEDVAAADAGVSAPVFAPPPRRGFGRKGA